MPKRASTRMSGNGPVTRRVSNLPFIARTSASTVPSPPSAIGHGSILIAGSAARNPAASASQTSRALRQPLNLSGATTIFIDLHRSLWRAEFEHAVAGLVAALHADANLAGRGNRLQKRREILDGVDAVSAHGRDHITG